MYCEKCNKSYAQNDKFCSLCGEKLVDELDIYAKQLLKGEEEGFNQIYNNTKSWVIKYVSMHLGNQEDTMDCTQEIYFKLYSKISLFHPEKGSFRPWFNMLVKNQLIDFTRMKGTEVLLDDEEVFKSIEDPTPIAEVALEQNENARLLNLILDSLPDEQKACITGLYFEGRKRKELAELLGVSEETVKSRLRLGKQKIEERVLELERTQGTKIYSFTPFVFFLLLGAEKNTQNINLEQLQQNIFKQISISEQVGKEILQSKACKVGVEKGEKALVSKTVEGAVGKVASMSAKAMITKTIAAITTASVIGTAGFTGYKVYSEHIKNEKIQEEKEHIQEEKSAVDKLLENIDMNYLKSELIMLPDFIGEVTDEQICNIAYGVTYVKHCSMVNGLEGENAFLEGRLIKDQDVLKIESDGYYSTIYLKQEAFYNIFEMFGKKYDKNVLLQNSNYGFSEEEGNIKLLIDDLIGVDWVSKITNLKVKHSSKGEKIMIEYTVETDNYEEIIQEDCVASIVPANNELGYIFVGKGLKKNNLGSRENIKYFSEDQLKQIAKDLNVPDDLKVEFEIGKKYHWEAGECWLVPVEVRHDGEMVARVDINPETMEHVSNIYIYSGK